MCILLDDADGYEGAALRQGRSIRAHDGATCEQLAAAVKDVPYTGQQPLGLSLELCRGSCARLQVGTQLGLEVVQCLRVEGGAVERNQLLG